jgi:hypothetical protein
MGLMPCKDFITNRTAPPPPFPGKCCDGLKSLYEDTPVCMCHFFDDDAGGLQKVMSAPLDLVNLVALMDVCHSDGPSEYESCEGKFVSGRYCKLDCCITVHLFNYP